MTLWQTYTHLTPRTRLYLGLSLITWAGIGLFVTERAEEKFGLVPTEQDREELGKLVPRVRGVDK